MGRVKSIANKEQLLNSLCKEIKVMIARFDSGESSRRNLHWLSWNRLETSKSGGDSCKDFRQIQVLYIYIYIYIYKEREREDVS